MDIKEIAGGGLVEKIRKGKELRKNIIARTDIHKEDLLPSEDLLRNYRYRKEISEVFFARKKRSIKSLVVFDFGQVSALEATENMLFIEYEPADIWETLTGLRKIEGLNGEIFVSGSPLDPEERFTTFPMIKINGEKIITLNVDLKIEERFFVGVELVKEEKEKEVV